VGDDDGDAGPALDDVGHARYLHDRLPGSSLMLLPGADELWFVGDTDELAGEVDRWLADGLQPPTTVHRV
jgi:hypothetical protein